MANQEALITIILYNFVLIAIGLWAKKRTSNQDDFYLGGRGLGPVVAALSASASSSSAWSLLGVSGAAYVWGLSAIWLLPGVLVGYIVSWTWVAPRLMEISKETGAVTLPELLFGDFEGQQRVNKGERTTKKKGSRPSSKVIQGDYFGRRALDNLNDKEDAILQGMLLGI